MSSHFDYTTLDAFDAILESRRERFFQLDIRDLSQVPADVAPSFSVWKPENPELMDFLALDMPRRLARGGSGAREIGFAHTGALFVYEISRMQES